MSKKEIGADVTIALPMPIETVVEEEFERLYAKMPFWKKVILTPFALIFLFSGMVVLKIFESEIEAEEK